MDLKLIIKGFIVGIGKIIPGVSGSMLAYTLKIYEPLMNAVTNFFNGKKNNVKLLLNFGIGLFGAIILFSKLILFLLNNYYHPTMYLFLGLIIGTLIPFTKTLTIKKKNIMIFIITLSIFFLSMNFYHLEKFVFTGSFLNYLYIIGLGGLDALTSIVPGISGTAILMMLGSYEFVLSILGNPFNLKFILYMLGVVIGVILVCFLMNYLLKNKKEETNTVIFAFMIGSIFILLSTLKSFNIGYLFFLVLGIIGGIKLEK